MYYVRIGYPESNEAYFTIDFLEEDSYSKDEIFNIKYKDLKQFDSMKVISTVFKIIKDYYNHNKKILQYFGYKIN